MYAEIFNVSPTLEEPAKFLQWASYGIAEGAVENESSIRASLQKFWEAKDDLYTQVSDTERGQLEKLDALAHGFWGALEEGLTSASAGDIWGASSSIRQHADAARQAYAGGSAASARATVLDAPVISQDAFGRFTSQVAVGEQQALKAAGDKWNPLGWIGLDGAGPFGIPKIVWAFGAAAVVWYLVTKDRR